MFKKIMFLVTAGFSFILTGCHDLNVKDVDKTAPPVININVSNLTNGTSQDIKSNATLNFPKGTRLQFIAIARNEKGGIKNLFYVAVDQPLTHADARAQATSIPDANGNIPTQLSVATDGKAALTNNNWKTSSTNVITVTASNYSETIVQQVVLTVNVPIDIPTPPQPAQPTLTVTSFKIDPAIVYPNENFTASWSYVKSGDNSPVDLVITKQYFQEPELPVYQLLDAPLNGTAQLPSGPSGFPNFRLTVRYRNKPSVTGQSSVLNRHILNAMPNTPLVPYLVITGPFSDPTVLFEKLPFIINYTFANAGAASLGGFDVDLLIDGVKEGTSKTIPTLAVGASNTISWNVSKELSPGVHSFDIVKAGTTANLGHSQLVFSTK